MNIILFNGPPGSGKDTAARYLHENWDGLQLPETCWFDRFSLPNKLAFAAITDSDLDEFGNNLTYEKIKEEPLELLFGKSYRNFQQDFSEKFMKQLYGEDIFARLFVHRISYAEPNDTILVPDCGFQIELDRIVELLPKANILVFRIHRNGCDFSKDTREYVTPCNVTFNDIENNNTIETFELAIQHIVREFLR